MEPIYPSPPVQNCPHHDPDDESASDQEQESESSLERSSEVLRFLVGVGYPGRAQALSWDALFMAARKTAVIGPMATAVSAGEF